MKQFNDVLRTLINDTNRFENRFGMVRDEEGMLAVGYLMPESLLQIPRNDDVVQRTSHCSGEHHR